MEEPTAFPKKGDMILKLKLPVPSVLLIHICEQPQSPPGRVSRKVVYWDNLQQSTEI